MRATDEPCHTKDNIDNDDSLISHSKHPSLVHSCREREEYHSLHEQHFTSFFASKRQSSFTIPLCILGAAYAYQSYFPDGEQGDTTTTINNKNMTDQDAILTTQGKQQTEEKKEDKEGEEDQQLFMGDDNLRYLESDDVECKPEGMWKKLWDSMNPSACLTPATACTNVLLDDETVDYHSIVPPMLRDMHHPGKPRTAALQQLYRFTDRERQSNR
jgi:hypothetical protein